MANTTRLLISTFRKVKKSECERAAVREQIRLSTKEREKVERNREQEKTTTLAQMGLYPSVSITELPEKDINKSSKSKVCTVVFVNISLI